MSTTTPTASDRIRLGEVERLAQGGDHAAVRSEHRVQRLDGQPHAGRGAYGTSAPIGVGDVRAGAVEVAAAGRQAAGDQDQDRRAERGRLVDGAAVVVEPARRR